MVRKGSLHEDEAKVSSTPVQLEGVSGHRLDGGDREADLAVRLVKQSVWSVQTVTEEWFSGKFHEGTIKYAHRFLISNLSVNSGRLLFRFQISSPEVRVEKIGKLIVNFLFPKSLWFEFDRQSRTVPALFLG